MALGLIYITNNVDVAKIAETAGVDFIMVDLEVFGKEERQKGMNTVKSKHTMEDVKAISGCLSSAELLVRINPWNKESPREIEDAINNGAQRIMLPMWKTPEEVTSFLNVVDNRVGTTLLLETSEAAECLNDVLDNPLIDEIHIGLNDLHLSYGLIFMFELLTNGKVEEICDKCRSKGITYGFGGVAKIGEGTLPAEKIIMEHYRLGSQRVILSRSFCNCDEIKQLDKIDEIFTENITKMRDFERNLLNEKAQAFLVNKSEVKHCVDELVRHLKEKK